MPKKSATVRVRPWTKADLPAIVACQRAAYPDYPDSGMYNKRIYQLQFAAFPQGQILAELDGVVVGYATSLIVQLDGLPHHYEYNELTGAGTFSTHTQGGDTLYGADIAVRPDMRGQGIAQKLYVGRRKLLRRYNLRRMIAYGRLTGYPKYIGHLTAQEYVDRVVAGELKDPALNAHLKAGYVVREVSLEVMRDEPSLDWATLLEYPNPTYDTARRRIAAAPLERPVRKIRVCAAQYLMRKVKDFDEFAQSVRFFAEVADEYHGHFLVLPELYCATLLNTFEAGLDGPECFRELATYTPRIVKLLEGLASEFGVFIVGGSMPMVGDDGVLRNVCPFVGPSGQVRYQPKLHVTPSERDHWGVRPGDVMQVFDTPLGRVAILVCYDIEFPELSRLLVLAGAEVLFVPFSTDESKAYRRVRVAAQACAIENGVFVVIAGNAGNMPTRNYMLNYARSAVFTPSDFGFPDTAVIAEADPNIETVVVADLDLAALDQFRDHGTVRPLADRRFDLYELRGKVPIQVVSIE